MGESPETSSDRLLRGDPVQWQVSPPQAFSYLNADGYGELTQVGSSGGLFVGVVNVRGEIVADPDFENTQVVELKPVSEKGTTTLVDGTPTGKRLANVAK